METIKSNFFGFCSLASEAAYFILGGPESGFMSFATKDDNNTSHWWLQNKKGEILDFTAAQFYIQGTKPPYDRGLLGKPVGFMDMRIDVDNPFGFNRKPSLRVQSLLKRFYRLMMFWLRKAKLPNSEKAVAQ